MKLYKHTTYSEYEEAQIQKNKEKFDRVSVKAKTILWIANYLKDQAKEVNNIICHGIRNGKEIRNFQKYFPDSRYIGTDISPSVEQYEFGVKLDFHEPNKDWVSVFDVLYSNSLDHSNNPELAVQTWTDQLNDEGVMFIEWTQRGHGINAYNDLDAADCFQATLKEYEELFLKKFSSVNIEKIDGVTYLLIIKDKK